MRIMHASIKNDTINTSKGPVVLDADGFAEVTEEHAAFLTENFGGEWVSDAPKAKAPVVTADAPTLVEEVEEPAPVVKHHKGKK